MTISRTAADVTEAGRRGAGVAAGAVAGGCVAYDMWTSPGDPLRTNLPGHSARRRDTRRRVIQQGQAGSVGDRPGLSSPGGGGDGALHGSVAGMLPVCGSPAGSGAGPGEPWAAPGPAGGGVFSPPAPGGALCG